MKICAVVGLGYVGLGLAMRLSRQFKTYGYDINTLRIDTLKKQEDRNHLVSPDELKEAPIVFTRCLNDIKSANFYIVCIPTPTQFHDVPDLEPLKIATAELASIIKKGDVIVFESTVYPGTTEDLCIPVLEQVSNLQCGVDFHVGYSPERINPGDTEHTLDNITKIISAQTSDALEEIKHVYQYICQTLYPVSTIKAAETIKLLENVQRDVNIALMNEFTQITHALNLDMHEILEAAKTKWCFVPFKPGFVGGHCISVDPYYLIFKAKQVGIQSELMLTARKVNDSMPEYVVQSMIKLLLKLKLNPLSGKIGIFGISYKENTNDTRNSLALNLITMLKQYGFECQIHDPYIDSGTSIQDIVLSPFEEMHELSVAIVVLQHNFYKTLGLKKLMDQCHPKILIDLPNLFIDEAKHYPLEYWSL